MNTIKHIPPDNPIHRLAPALRQTIRSAQDNAFDTAFPSAASFLATLFDQLRVNLVVPESVNSIVATEFAEKSFGEFTRFFLALLQEQQYPEQAIPQASAALATRAMLLRAFADPDAAMCLVREKVISVVESFPKTAGDIEVGRKKAMCLIHSFWQPRNTFSIKRNSIAPYPLRYPIRL